MDPLDRLYQSAGVSVPSARGEVTILALPLYTWSENFLPLSSALEYATHVPGARCGDLLTTLAQLAYSIASRGEPTHCMMAWLWSSLDSQMGTCVQALCA